MGDISRRANSLTPRNSAFQRQRVTSVCRRRHRHAFPDARRGARLFPRFHVAPRVLAFASPRCHEDGHDVCSGTQFASDYLDPEPPSRVDVAWLDAAVIFASVTFQSPHTGNLSTADLCNVIKCEHQVPQFVPQRNVVSPRLASHFRLSYRAFQWGLMWDVT